VGDQLFSVVLQISQLLGDIADKRFRLLVSMSPFRGLSVTFVYYAQTAEDIDKISFVYSIPGLMFLQIALKFSLHRSTPSSTNFAQKQPTPCRFKRRRHSMANCLRVVTDSAMFTMEAYKKLPSLFRMLPSQTLYDLPFPKIRTQNQLRDTCCHQTNTIEDIDNISFAYGIVSRAMSPFAQLLWPLLKLLFRPSSE